MSKKNQIANVAKAYVVSPNGTPEPITYSEAMENAKNYKISDETIGYLRNIHDGIKEQTNGTFKIGYNLAQLCKGDNPEYKRLGYNTIRDVITDMFDINEVTGYKWADTASKFVTYDAKTGEYHSIFATEFKGKIYDFTMSQLSEMRFPLDKKTGDEIIDLSIWKIMFDNRVISTSSTTKGIRKIQNILVALAKNGKELSVQNVNDLFEKSERLNMTPEKALPYKENAQGTQGATQGAQGTQGATQGAQGATQGAQGTQDATQGAQGTQDATQGAQGTQDATQGAQGTQGTAQDVTNGVELQKRLAEIETAIAENTICNDIYKTVVSALNDYVVYIERNKSEIVQNAIVETLEKLMHGYSTIIAADNTAQDATAQDATAQDATAQDATAQDATAQDATATPETATPEKAKTAKPKTVKRDKTVSTRKTKSSK